MPNSDTRTGRHNHHEHNDTDNHTRTGKAVEEVSNGLTTTTGTEQPQPPPPLLHLIVISGASGTGKSTLAYEVCWRLRNGVDFCYDAQGSGGEDRYGDVEGLIEEGEGGGEGVDGGGGGGGGCGEYYDEKKTKKLMHAHIDADNLDALYPLPADHDSGLMLSVLGVQWQVFLEVFARVLWYPEMGYQTNDKNGKLLRPREAVLIISGTGLFEDLQRIVAVIGGGLSRVALLQNSSKENPTKKSTVSKQPIMMRVTALILSADKSTTQARLRARVIGGELAEHLKSSANWRDRLDALYVERKERAEGGWGSGGWIQGDGEAGSGGGKVRYTVRVEKIRSDRPLQVVVDEAMGVAGLCLSG